jgi:hypothetical protein
MILWIELNLPKMPLTNELIVVFTVIVTVAID